MISESFSQPPWQNVIRAYLYDQYGNDANLQAFFDSYNAISQGYLDWFNETPLGSYTNPNVSGPLLDWVANNVYGMVRPVISTQSTYTGAGLASAPLASGPLLGFIYSQSGTAQIANDDIFRRTITWYAYAGDGKQMSIGWIKRRVARFLYGANGGDVSLDDSLNISIYQTKIPPKGAINTASINALPINGFSTNQPNAKHSIIINIPTSTTAQYFADLVASRVLRMPFQITVTVTLS